MSDLSVLTIENFTAHLNDEFIIEDNGQKVVLKLVQVTPLGDRPQVSKRDPFAITFHGDPRLRGPQRVYTLQHPKLGNLDIFLVPLQPTKNASIFEAVFT